MNNQIQEYDWIHRWAASLFMEINLMVKDFLREFEDQTDHVISGSAPWQDESVWVTPLWLFTHTITHEFHHKGQIVSMSRQLGYNPTVTDLYHHTRPKSDIH